jgi:hypothetical protein
MNGPIVLTFLQLKDKMFVSLVLTILTPFSCTTFCIDVSGFSIKMVGCLELGDCLVDFYLEELSIRDGMFIMMICLLL